MAMRDFFFSAAPTAQNSSELHFRLMNYFIQPSLLKIKDGFFQRICGELVLVISRNNCAKSLSIKILHYIKKIADSDLAQ